MNDPAQEISDCPVWARDDAFPLAPDGWGWVDAKGRSHRCASQQLLISAIRDDRDGSLVLIWAPGHSRMILPEELEGTGDALRAARDRWTHDDLTYAAYKLKWFGGVLVAFAAWAFYRGFNTDVHGTATALDRAKIGLGAILSSTSVGLAMLMFVILAFIPWYQARKRRQELGKWTQVGIAASVPALRFETWLERQRAPFTKVLLGLVTLVAVLQIFGQVKADGWKAGAALLQHWQGTSAAGLIKNRYLQGEWWRLFTAPFLHGNLVHFLMNASALVYLGRRVETFARWPHLPLVFLFAASVGGETSVRFTAAPTVGASGGLMGWLGFLLVFETLHARLVPRPARRRLAAGVFLTALIGLVGYRYIDNAAHAGGLLAGMLYAVIVFPKSASPHRPRTTITDLVAGGAALVVLAAAALFAVSRIAAG